ncbi:2-hydroxy-palmitic acid dioxygenase mpo1-like [Actinidia eriantha]|uniref:2-hydroxy-palmitic acid dioxygenase mpo1-like n=1 Tax=Actinidia eriantha TaxID=165200 RepID=UPI002589EF38|nr:2-hydroxy-palmitic acid dioxygenase mpo1-like [Actinidia eriantha]XP_057474689.1 2-hydroxy-palmitic acid dioxygenase mpo1-like [Actinidia eriantha]
MGKIGLFDLERHFAFYGAYHRNPVNILIHMLFVWPIFFTTAVLLYFTPPFFDCPFHCRIGLVPNFGLLSTLIYALFYICFDKKAGSLAAMLCLACWVSGSLLAKHLGFSLAWKVVLAAQLFCWTGQFIGHGVFEKRAPALLDNLTQAFLMAPFFVLLEALQSFFGYEPYPGFHASVKAKIDAEIKEWKDTKGKKTS